VLKDGTILHSSVATDDNTYVMVTELPDTIEFRHTGHYQVFRALYSRYLLTYLLILICMTI